MSKNNFMFGAGTSHFQIGENNNTNAKDDFYNAYIKNIKIYKEDYEAESPQIHISDESIDKLIVTLKKIGANSYRFSVPWARINPSEGVFSDDELNRYTLLLNKLRENGITPIVTLHHYTSPQWFRDKGGFYNKKNIQYFLEFTKKIAEISYDGGVEYFVAFNELTNLIGHERLLFLNPNKPIQNAVSNVKFYLNVISAIKSSYNIIHDTYNERNETAKDEIKIYPKVGIASSIWEYVSYSGRFQNIYDILNNLIFYLPEWLLRKHTDFIGINFYGVANKPFIDHFPKWLRPLYNNIIAKDVENINNSYSISEKPFNWILKPEHIKRILERLNKIYGKIGKEILITEIGTYGDKEDDVCKFYDIIFKSLEEYIIIQKIHELLNNNNIKTKKLLELIGVTIWSIVDNTEWDMGHVPHFGISSYDNTTRIYKIKERAENVENGFKSIKEIYNIFEEVIKKKATPYEFLDTLLSQDTDDNYILLKEIIKGNEDLKNELINMKNKMLAGRRR